MTIGDKWNGWTVDSFIGEGSFGRVYRIVRTEFGHTYESALKVIRIPQTDAEISAVRNEGMSDESLRMYFYGMVEDIVSEVALMSELKGNSNIVSYEDHSVVELKDRFGWEIYIRMEILTPLFTYLRNNTLTAADVVRMGTDLCCALELCNKYNIIHRDIKPENIFVSRQGSFKLGDFGIARQMEKTQTEMSKKGTYSYMAPEVYKGLPYDSTVDVYSLGIVLYRFLNNNRTPFLPPYPEAIRYSDKQKANEQRVSGSPLPPPCNASEKLSDIILKASVYDPAGRFRSAGEMRAELESLEQTEDDEKVIFPVDGLEGIPDAGKTGADDKTRIAMAPTVPLFELDYDKTVIRAEHNGRTSEDSEADETENGVADAHIHKESSHSAESGEKSRRKRLIIALSVVLIIAAAGIYRYMHCAVPSVMGLDADTAKNAIEAAGLEYSEEEEFSDDVEKGLVVTQTDEGNTVKRGTVITVSVSRGKAIEVPDITKMSKTKASKALGEAGLVMKTDGREYSDTLTKNRIISQTPAAGEICEEGEAVTVVLSKGITQVEVPDVTGKTVDEAAAELESAGLKAVTVTTYSNSYSAGFICDQSVPAGEKTDIHSTITLYESVGAAPQAQKPKYTGSGNNGNKSAGNRNSTPKKKEKKVDTFG